MKPRTYLAGLVMLLALLQFESSDAAGIETLVMPGPLVEGHAELEDDCSNCHEAFERDNQRTLCLDCHEEVAVDIQNSGGFHGLFEEAKSGECADCHADHEGRNANIMPLDEGAFDHNFTDFPLEGEHINNECTDCHLQATLYRDAPSDCLSCHEDDNVHEEFMGTSCGDCHNPTGWPGADFDHDTTDFPLVGKHIETLCLDCHEDQTFQGAPDTCYGCHAEDDAHNGRSGRECDNCHNPTDWADTSFDHERDTNFALTNRHAELTCDDCHSDDPFADENDPACVNCHIEDDAHDRHLGEQCETCHVTEDWVKVVFDHDVDTEHPIVGAHMDLVCIDCHIEPVFEVKLTSECHDCHAEDDPHEGEQGITCKDCHNESDWKENVFFDHDLTRFPLLGNHIEQACDACHDSHVFRDAPTDCVDCHLEDDPHEGRYHEKCADCHNPVDWLAWQFDHNTQSAFLLEGAHVEVLCEDCHRQVLSAMQDLGARCGDCHRPDDVHDGEFGLDCARCHSAESFRDVRTIQ